MNKTTTLFASSLLVTGALGLAACTDPVGDAPRAQVQDAAPAPVAAAAPQAGDVRYAISEQTSKLGFVGAKVTGKHDGSFGKLSGTITAPEGKPEAARIDVTIDVATLTTDSEKLTGHMKGPDFFDVAKFPTARFVSTNVEKLAAADASATHTVTGDLTLKDVTKRISFPATVKALGDVAEAHASFGINRKDFGIVYPGKPDDLIKDEVLLTFDVRAPRAAATGG